MVGPVIQIGPQGNSGFAQPDYSPLSRGMGNLGTGLGSMLSRALAPPPPPPERKFETDIHGVKRYLDDGSMVFQSSEGYAPPRDREDDVHGVNRYLDDGSAVFPTSADYEPPGPDSPTSVREYEFAIDGGFEGTYPEFLEARRASNTVNINNRTPPPGYMFDPQDPEGVALLPMPGGPADELSNDQSRSATFADRAAEVEGILSQVGEDGQTLDMQGTGMVGGILQQLPGGNLLTSADRQRYEQAKRNFINAVLRRESGAVINNDEFTNADAQYFPQIGDEQAVIDQKRQNRASALAGLVRSAGPRYAEELAEREQEASARAREDALVEAVAGGAVVGEPEAVSPQGDPSTIDFATAPMEDILSMSTAAINALSPTARTAFRARLEAYMAGINDPDFGLL